MHFTAAMNLTQSAVAFEVDSSTDRAGNVVDIATYSNQTFDASTTFTWYADIAGNLSPFLVTLRTSRYGIPIKAN